MKDKKRVISEMDRLAKEISAQSKLGRQERKKYSSERLIRELRYADRS